MLFGVPMQFVSAGRRPLSPGSRAGLGAALVLLAIVSAVEIADGTQVHFLGLFAAAPFLAAAFASWRMVLVVGVFATVVGIAFGFAAQAITLATGANVVGIALATAIAAVVAVIREKQADRIAELSKLATVAQQAHGFLLAREASATPIRRAWAGS